MQCPKCGHSNSDDAQKCQSCNLDLTKKPPQPPKAKTSKLAILSVVLALPSLFFFILTGLPAIITAIISYFKIKYSNGKLKGKPISIAGIILSLLSMCGFVLLWSLDAPPIPNDYTIADLRSAPADCNESYELLRSLVYLFVDPRQEIENLNDSIALAESITGQKSQLKLPEGFTEKYLSDDEYEPLLSDEGCDLINEVAEIIEQGKFSELSNILNKNADTIKQAWDKTEKARDIIHQLNEFPEIADLYEPNHTAIPLKMFSLIELSRLYNAYAYMQYEPNNIHNFTKELIEMDSVYRKLSSNTRLLVTKLCCFIIMSKNIQTANAIANTSEASHESIGLLAEHFTPFTNEQMFFKNPALFEYLSMKYSLSEASAEFPFRMNPLFKKNSMLRIYRNHCEDLINITEDVNDTSRERLTVWPSFYPFKEPTFPKKNEKVCLIYRCYNPAGSLILQMMDLETGYKSAKEQGLRIKGQSELLQIILSLRLGKEVDSTAQAYIDKYKIDIENKIIFSPGPDGKPETKDDIKLPINPEVLGLIELSD